MTFFRGFLKGDKALGQVQVKLNAFDNKCEIHDCLDVSHFFNNSNNNNLLIGCSITRVVYIEVLIFFHLTLQ